MARSAVIFVLLLAPFFAFAADPVPTTRPRLSDVPAERTLSVVVERELVLKPKFGPVKSLLATGLRWVVVKGSYPIRNTLLLDGRELLLVPYIVRTPNGERQALNFVNPVRGCSGTFEYFIAIDAASGKIEPRTSELYRHSCRAERESREGRWLDEFVVEAPGQFRIVDFWPGRHAETSEQPSGTQQD